MSNPARSVFGFLLILSAALGGCAVPVVTLFDRDNTNEGLAIGESSNTHFFTSDSNFDTGIGLNAGSAYDVEITILSHWIDSYIDENENGEELDERGFDNSVMPLELLGVTRRSRSHRWFELMLYQSTCGQESLRGVTDLSNDEANGSYRFVAACDGNLRLFVNDTPGFYLNNAGYANITLTRMN
jgi:hypothetical protein